MKYPWQDYSGRTSPLKLVVLAALFGPALWTALSFALGWLQPQREILLDETVLPAQGLEATAQAEELVFQGGVRIDRAAGVVDGHAKVLLAATCRRQDLPGQIPQGVGSEMAGDGAC